LNHRDIREATEKTEKETSNLNFQKLNLKTENKRGRASLTYKRLRKWHKWFSIVLSLFILVFAFSGIVLNHRSLFSSVDVNREILPEVYQYQNWNLAALRGSLNLEGKTSLMYGNIGVWLSPDDFETFEDFNVGFPPGIDNRKISKVVQTPQKQIFAATYFDLFIYDNEKESWRKLPLPGHETRIVDLLVVDEELWIFTRSHLLKSDYTQAKFSAKIHTLPPPENYDNKAGLFKTLWVIHSGEIYGLPGKVFVDLMALIFIFLTLTGLMLWLFPGWIKRLKRKGKNVKSLAATMKFSLKWHNKLGYALAVFLILTTATGMFLRPPLLIPIASVKVPKIPFTELDSPNPWFDKFRAAIRAPESGRITLSTSDGFYYSDDHFQTAPVAYAMQPPVSVMGINVLEPLGYGGFLVGSFSGLFTWFPEQDYIEDALSREVWQASEVLGSPFAADAVAGMIWRSDGSAFLFDYATGAKPFLHKDEFAIMPSRILDASPMSAWNAALEFHTARIYAALIGDFYILIIPLAGLSILFILISGFWMYWVGFRRKGKKRV